MKYDFVNRRLNLRRRGLITGKEVVKSVFDALAHDAQFERVSDVMPTLLTQDSAEVLDWLKWVEPRCDDPQWIPFPIDTRFGPTEWDRLIRENYRKVAELVKAALLASGRADE